MVFLPGNHTLDRNIEAESIQSVMMYPKSKGLTVDTHITCKQSAMFIFNDIDEVHISRIYFNGCGGNTFKFIQIFTLQNCGFFGHGAERPALELFRTTAKISFTSFMTYFNNISVVDNGSAHATVTAGGAIIVDELCNVSIENCTFEGNTAEVGGGLYVSGSSINITNSSFVDNHAKSQRPCSHCHGGGIFIVNSTLHVWDTHFHRNGADRNGGVLWAHKSTIISSNCHFSNNRAQQNGGVLELSFCKMNSTNDLFYNNRAVVDGGVMSLIYSTVKSTNGSFYNNYVYSEGGVIKAEFSNLTSTSVQYYSNRAEFGGSMSLFFSIFISKDDRFYYNSALNDGGVMWVNHSTLNSINGLYYENRAKNGGVLSLIESNLQSNGEHFHHNSVNGDGGVINAERSNMSSNNSHFNNNRAWGDGGVLLLLSSRMNSKNNQFYNNWGFYYGGVMWATNSVININNESIYNNSVIFDGGAIYAHSSNISSKSVHFYGNRAEYFGGVMILFHSTFNSKDDQFYYNIAVFNGGVLWMNNCTLNSINGHFYHNQALMEIDNSRLIFESFSFKLGDGGMMYAINSTISSNNGHYYNNRAGYAGGVWSILSSSLDSNNGYFYNNSAKHSGGVLHASYSNISTNDEYFKNNRAGNYGGVMLVRKCSVNSSHTRFYNNSCSRGAVISSARYSIVSSYTDSYYDNIATRDGGVVEASESTVIFDSDNFRNNQARGRGGVIYAYDTVINSSRNYFSNNSAFKHGGVINGFYDNIIYSTNDYFLSNRAGDDGGVLWTIKSTVNCYSNYFIDNSARDGGVMYIQQSTLNSTSDNFSENIADVDGGVIWTQQSRITFSSDNFINNSATRDAGVMYINYVSIVNSTNDYFLDNTAGRDGGIVCSGLGTIGHLSITVSKVTAYNNVAGRDGGAFRMEQGRIEINGGNFNSSSAKRGGVISADRINITLRDNIFTKIFAEIGSVLYICGSDVRTYGEMTLLQNTATKAVAYFMDSTIRLLGNTYLKDNIGSIVVIISNITFTNSVTIMSGRGSEPVQLIRFEEGGAITAIQSNVVFDGECRLCDNQARIGGAIRSVKSTINVIGELTIANNSAAESGGGVHLYQSELTCQLHSKIEFMGNNAIRNGGGIYAISSSINQNSKEKNESNSLKMQFIENRAEFGGGIYLQMNSVIYIRKYAASNESYPVIEFNNNIADYGGAVFISDNTEFGVCTEFENETHSISNECPFQVLSLYDTMFNKMKPSSQNIYFFGNTATFSGSSLYGSFMDRCIVNHLTEGNITYDIDINSPFEEMQVYETSYLQDISNIKTSEIGTPPAKVCFCNDNTPNCTYQHPPIFTERGETVVVSLAVLDEVDNVVTDAEVFGYLSNNVSGICRYENDQHINGTCNDFTFRAYSIHASDELILHTEPGPCQYSTPQQIQLTLQFPWCENCPIGFQRFDDQELGCRCDCHSDIQDYFTNCDSRNQTLQKTSSVWISYLNDTAKSMIGFIIHPHCPLDYCTPTDSASVYINFSEEKGADAQCAYNRSGTLCGACPPNLSLSLGSSKCLSCPKLWPILTVVIILSSLLSGIALVALILVLNLTVAVGTINAIIFYANIVAANSKILLPFSEPNFATVLISWLNLEFGLDACFFKGMDIYWKTWLQIVFPSYVIFLVAMIIIISEHSMRFAHLIGKRNPIATLTTLILLSYAKFLHTIIAAFSFSTLEYPDGSRQTVWLPDGTVSYFSGKHIALFIAAVFILILGIVYTGLLFSWQWLLRYQHKKIFKWARNQKLCQFLEPYHAPYNFKHRYWTGLLLLVRAVLYIVSATNVSGDPRVALVSTIFLVGFLLLLKGLLGVRVYKNTAIDVMESLTYFNLMFLSAFSWYSLESDRLAHTAISYTSVLITFIQLIAVLAYNTYTYTGIFSMLQKVKHINKLFVWFRVKRAKHPKKQYESNSPPEFEDSSKKNKTLPTYSFFEIHKPKLEEKNEHA